MECYDIIRRIHRFCTGYYRLSEKICNQQYTLQTVMEGINYNYVFIIAIVTLVLAISLFSKMRTKKQGRERLSVELVETKQLTHDTIVFTFLLPNANRKLGLKIGEHIEIEQNIKGEIVKRKYTPISTIDKVGSFELLLKIYRPIEQFPSGGKMSCFLADSALHSKITITLPYGRFNYLGKRNTKITDFEGRVTQKKYKNFYMVAGGTGITPIFQIIQYCCENQTEDQRPGLFLLFANRTENDILLKEALETYAAKYYNIKVFFSVDQSVTSGWTGFTGYVSEDKIKQSLPDDYAEGSTLFMSCGPPILCNNCEKFWKNLGVTNDAIYRF